MSRETGPDRLDEYLNRRPAELRTVLEAAAAEFQKGNSDKARSYFERALEIDPGIGLIGSYSDKKVNKGSGTVDDTRQAMKDLVNPNQDYYWTPEWQEDEKQADEDIKIGNTVIFSSASEALDYLKKL